MTRIDRSQGRHYTYGDYLTWPDDERWEIIEGEAFDMTPAPSRHHQGVLVALTLQFGNFFQGKPSKVYIAPFDVRLPRKDEPDEKVDTVVQPDLIVVCDEQKLDERGLRGAPDLAIEILSPRTASKDCIKKRALYEKHGVKEFWTVSNDRNVNVYRLGPDGRYGSATAFWDTDLIEVPLFPGLVIDLGKVFPNPKPIVGQSPASYQA